MITDKLSVGSSVLVAGGFHDDWYKGKVTKKSTTGQVTVEFAGQTARFTKYGQEFGSGYHGRRIEEPTEANIARATASANRRRQGKLKDEIERNLSTLAKKPGSEHLALFEDIAEKLRAAVKETK